MFIKLSKWETVTADTANHFRAILVRNTIIAIIFIINNPSVLETGAELKGMGEEGYPNIVGVVTLLDIF